MLCDHQYDDESNNMCDLVTDPESYLRAPYETSCKQFKPATRWKISPNEDFIKMLKKHDDTVIFPLRYKSITAATKTNGATMKIEIPRNIIGTDARDERNWSLFVVAFTQSDTQRSNKYDRINSRHDFQ